MVPARRRRALPLPLLSLLSAARAARTAAAGPKTILSVLVDDLGHADTQVGGRNMVSPTPVLGELAKEGIVLESHCALPIPHPPLVSACGTPSCVLLGRWRCGRAT